MRPGNAVTWVAVLPAAVALIAVIGYPLVDGVRISLGEWHGVGPVEWVGLDNYVEVVTDPQVGASLLLTAAYALSCSLGIVVIAALLAAAVSRGARGSGFYRVVWFLPSVAPATAAGVFWSTSFQPVHGAVNGLLGMLGLGNNHAWLADPSTAIYPAIAVTIWSGVGFAFLLILGAMEQVPVSVYEAAGLDGASAARQFRSITLPLIRPTLVLCLMLETIWSANNFSVIWAMTQGGPGDATATLPVLIYKQAFSFTNYGVASAMAIVGGAILLILGLVSLRMSRERNEGNVR